MPGDNHEHTYDQVQIDPAGVIASLQRQLNDKTLECAKLESFYSQQLNEMGEELKEAREIIAAQIPLKDRAKVKHEGRTTKSSKKKKTKKEKV